MTHTAIYPGTFDPIHLGHVDIATRAATIFDELVLAIYDRPAKSLMFTVEERVELARQALADLPNARVISYGGLTAEFARGVGAQAIVRGLRVISDFELEYQMALTNRQLAPEVDTVCLMTRQSHAFLSSSIVKEIALLEGDVSRMVPPHVAAALEIKRREREKNHEPVPLVSLRD
ncbi:MAG: pantetheine-phosphate adenylyltransferase [Chloroflexi bacterium]|nr:MAG: pantetheine-phosphate adenylyltransferase [Chloroflexota bacterium]